jgi:hypothetical protein
MQNIKNEGSTVGNWTRRDFLRTVSVSVPNLSLIPWRSHAQRKASVGAAQEYDEDKLTRVDPSPYFDCSPNDLGPHPRSKALGGESDRDGLIRTPAGDRHFRDILFLARTRELPRSKVRTKS